LSILKRVRPFFSADGQHAARDPEDKRRYFHNYLLHFRPGTVPERTLRFSLTWGLGGAAVVLVCLLFASGLLLKFVYEPTPSGAYASIVYLGSEVPFGQLLRNVHRWSGNGLLFVLFLHLLRVFYTGAYLPPRHVNWIIGLVLFLAAILSNFTGYLLPWDQVAYWAVTISTSMLDYVPWIGEGLKRWLLGGSEPGPATLLNFYAIHTALLPVTLLFVIPLHFWRIRRAGGLVIPRSPDEDPSVTGEIVDAVPHLVTREIAMAVTVIAAVLLFSMAVNAPLAEPANPGLSPNPTKAPWYFMGAQELLMHFHPVFALLVIPGALTLGLLLLPAFHDGDDSVGVWFRSARGRQTAWIAMISGGALTVAGVWLDEFGGAAALSAPQGMLRNGLLPFAVILALCGGFYLAVRKVFDANRGEAVQALFTLLVGSFTVLTLIGVWFRGEGMKLMWAG
jgi:quinol-cytochrome oxidoreductase complex cytochrome b subunit